MLWKKRTYREYEVVSPFEDFQEKLSPSPHHLDEILRHVKLLAAEIYAVRYQPEAVQTKELAPVVRRLIDGDEKEMIYQRPRAFSEPETIKKHVQHSRNRCGFLIGVRLVYDGDYHSLVRHWRSGQSRFKLVSWCNRIIIACVILQTLNPERIRNQFQITQNR